MAWTGTPVITSLGKSIVRITGVSLGGTAVGTIGLNGGSGNISLPSNFPTDLSGSLTLADLVMVWYVYTTPGGGNESRHVHVEKVVSPAFLITFTNDANQDTSPLEIYIQYAWSAIR